MRPIQRSKTVKFSIAVAIIAAAILVGCTGVDGRPLVDQAYFQTGFFQGCMNGTIMGAQRSGLSVEPESARDFCHGLRDIFIERFGIEELEKPCTEGCI